MKVLFSVHEYDHDGDVHTKGIFLHINDVVTLHVGEKMSDLDNLIEQLGKIKKEISEHWEGQHL